MNEDEIFVSGAGYVNVDLMFSGLSRLPAKGEELYAEDFTLRLGGGIPATMINLSRLGIPVKIQAALGNDMFSAFARKEFEKAGIMPYNLTPDTSDIPLNVSVVLLTPDDRTIVTYSDGMEESDKILEEVYQMTTGAVVCAMDPRFGKIYGRLHDEGTVLVLDTGWNEGLSLENYRPLLEMADYFLPSRDEALKITGTDSVEGAADILSRFFETVIIKLDADGCMICQDGITKIIPVIPEFDHVDSTGAGDAFLAGFIYGLYHHESIEKCVLYGNITGGKCVTQMGCLTAYCTETELLELAHKYQSFTDHNFL